MTKDETLKMALEVMRNQGDVSVDEWIATEKAIKEALAQPEQEPMTKAGELRAIKTELWKQTEQDGECKHCTDGCPACDARKLPEQEPVAWGVFEGNLHDMFFSQEEAQKMADLKGTHAEVRPLYTTPPQRTWVGLTDEEILTYRHMIDWTAEWSYINFARAIEVAHGIKGQA
jgi:hypothetical protein